MIDYKDTINQIVYGVGINLINNKRINISTVKDELIIYLYLIVLVINNGKYSQKFNNLNNCTEEFRKITFLRNDSNYIVGVHNKKIMKAIRNAFTHGSGKIIVQDEDLIISNDTRPTNVNDNNNTTIKISKYDLVRLLEKVSTNIDSNDNDIISTCLETINEIKDNNILSSKKIGYIILLVLLFSYNKESLYDKYMGFVDSSLDLSDLKIFDARILDDESQQNIKSYYEDNTMIFKSIEDLLMYKKELFMMAKNGYFVEKTETEKKLVWDPKLMSTDNDTGIHIPNNILMTHLRNGISHGLMKFDDNGILFNDYNKKEGNYFKIYISFEQMNSIFISNYFKEGVSTSVDLHHNMSDNLYRTQIALSKKSFSNYVAYYRKKFPHKSEIEVINYMIDNNKISAFLYENPNNIKEFVKYSLPDSSCMLLDYISNYYSVNTDDMILKSPDIWLRDTTTGILNYLEYLKGNDFTYLLSKMLYFKNRYSYETKEEIKASINKNDILQMSKNIRLASLYSFTNHDYFEQLILGNYMNNTNEIERIMCVLVYYDEYVLSHWNDNLDRDIDNFDNVLCNSSEYRMTSNAYDFFESNESKMKRSLRKVKLKLKMLDFFKDKISDSKIKNLSKIFDKIFLKNKYDQMIMLYVYAKLKESVNEQKNKKNNL